MGVDRDLVMLNRMLRVLARGEEGPPARITALYAVVFQGEDPRNRVFTLSAAGAWDETSLARALGMVREIVARYVLDFHDPHAIPVTHYRRQKQLAIHLDRQFAPVLHECVRRFGTDPYESTRGFPETDTERYKDPFVDEPILFLKQEARVQRRVTLDGLRDRFSMKLAGKGLSDLPGPNVEINIDRRTHRPLNRRETSG